MKKALILICSSLVLNYVCPGYAVYSAMAGEYQNKNRNAAPSLDCLIPPALNDTLLAAGVPSAGLKPVYLKNDRGAVFVFTTPAKDKMIAVLPRPDAQGLLLLIDESTGSLNTWSLAAFDLSRDTYHLIEAEAVSTECLREIAATGKSVFFILYDCVLLADQRYCLSSIIDLFIELYITGIVCRPENPTDNATSLPNFFKPALLGENNGL
ncbi:MAG: hypothetical protein WCQ99_01035 [Pseudomonadota bacterium]